MSADIAESTAHPEELAVLRKEAYTMALYVAICLLAAITALTESEASHAHMSTIVWGLTVGVAVLASIPLLFLAQDEEFVGVTVVLAAFIGLVGFAVARSGGASRLRALIYGGVVLALAAVVIALKNALAGH